MSTSLIAPHVEGLFWHHVASNAVRPDLSCVSEANLRNESPPSKSGTSMVVCRVLQSARVDSNTSSPTTSGLSSLTATM